jgi:hypothetical protein
MVFAGVGVLVITLMAAGLTELTLAHGGRLSAIDGVAPAPSHTPTPTPTPSPSATATPTPSATPTPRTAVTNGFVHLRAAASTSSAIVANLDGGTTVQLGSYVDSQWQGVVVNGQSGYIFRSYLNY